MSLSIGTSSILELGGLYSLNDLHHASGGLRKDVPSRFLRLDTTQDLITEIHQNPEMGLALKVIHGGANPGTYACRELVIAYAAWISPAFHLKVIRTFLAVTTPQADPSEALEQALKSGRWLLSTEDGRLTLKPVAANAYIITEEKFAAVIGEPGIVSTRYLPAIIAAAAGRMIEINQCKNVIKPVQEGIGHYIRQAVK